MQININYSIIKIFTIFKIKSINLVAKQPKTEFNTHAELTLIIHFMIEMLTYYSVKSNRQFKSRIRIPIRISEMNESIFRNHA